MVRTRAEWRGYCDKQVGEQMMNLIDRIKMGKETMRRYGFTEGEKRIVTPEVAAYAELYKRLLPDGDLPRVGDVVTVKMLGSADHVGIGLIGIKADIAAGMPVVIGDK